MEWIKNIILSLAIVGFIFNAEIIYGLTVSQASLIIVTIALILKFNKIPSIKKTFLQGSVFIATFLIYFGIFGLLPYVSEKIVSLSIIKLSVSWLLMLIPFIFGYMYADLITKKLASYTCLISSFIMVIFGLLSIYIITTTSMTQLRYIITSLLPGGINGFLFGSFFVGLFALLYGINDGATKRAKYLIFFCIFSPIIFNLILGSRQFLLASLLVLYFWLSQGYSVNIKPKKIITRIIPLMVTISAISAIILTSDTIVSVVMYRYDDSLRQLEDGYERFEIWKTILSAWDPLSILGNGIGAGATMLGKPLDSFILEVFFDHGMAGGMFFSILILIIAKTYVANTKIQPYFQEIRIISLSILLVLTWFALFNEVIREYIIWMFIGILFRYKEKQRQVILNTNLQMFVSKIKNV